MKPATRSRAGTGRLPRRPRIGTFRVLRDGAGSGIGGKGSAGRSRTRRASLGTSGPLPARAGWREAERSWNRMEPPRGEASQCDRTGHRPGRPRHPPFPWDRCISGTSLRLRRGWEAPGRRTRASTAKVVEWAPSLAASHGLPGGSGLLDWGGRCGPHGAPGSTTPRLLTAGRGCSPGARSSWASKRERRRVPLPTWVRGRGGSERPASAPRGRGRRGTASLERGPGSELKSVGRTEGEGTGRSCRVRGLCHPSDSDQCPRPKTGNPRRPI